MWIWNISKWLNFQTNYNIFCSHFSHYMENSMLGSLKCLSNSSPKSPCACFDRPRRVSAIFQSACFAILGSGWNASKTAKFCATAPNDSCCCCEWKELARTTEQLEGRQRKRRDRCWCCRGRAAHSRRASKSRRGDSSRGRCLSFAAPLIWAKLKYWPKEWSVGGKSWGRGEGWIWSVRGRGSFWKGWSV